MSTGKNWKIEDSMFFPLGLFNKSSHNKTAFVTWGVDSLITHIFKKENNSNILKNTYSMSISGIIKDITVTEFNTICLTNNGKVYYFSSCKSLKQLSSLNGVRCICSRTNGFAIICVDELNKIFCEIYSDFTNENDIIKQDSKKFDISFDEMNMFNSSWINEKFSIISIKLNNTKKEFFQNVLKKDINTKELYLFTIANNLLYLLLSDDDENDYDIGTITIVATEIDSIHFFTEINVILVAMTCGSVEIIFYSEFAKCIERKIQVLGSDILATSYSEKSIYYSDGNKVVQVNLCYDNDNHTFKFNKQEKPLNGIIALTWVTSLNKLVCLSENNIFYKIKFISYTNCDAEPEYKKISDKKIKELDEKITNIIDLIDEPARIHEAIDIECNNQEIMAIAKRKNIYEAQARAEIMFYRNIPEVNKLTIYPENGLKLTENTYFVMITIDIIWNVIFDKGLWSLIINLSGENKYTKIIKLTPDIMKNSFNVVLFVKKNDDIVIIPKIDMEFCSYVNIENDSIFVTFPVDIKNLDLKHLFTTFPTKGLQKRKPINQSLLELANKNVPFENLKIQSEMYYYSSIETPLIMSFNDIFEMFFSGKIMSNKDQSELDVYLLGEKVQIKYIEIDNSLEIKTFDPGALYYTKLYLSKNLSSDYYNTEHVKLKDNQRTLMRIQSEVENPIAAKLETQRNLLSRAYLKLRENT